MLIHICMLNKRTNILFDEELWQNMLVLAQAKNKSVGALIRQAVEDVYFSDERAQKCTDAYQKILVERKVSQSKINYGKLIDYGRKY